MRFGLVLAGMIGMASPAAANEGQDMLMSLNNQEIATVMSMMLDGYTQGGCPGVTRVFFAGMDDSDNAYWDVACIQGEYRLQIAPTRGGPVAVVMCSEMERLGAPCFRVIEGARQ